ncbi:MAG: hypothetical protein K8W52_14805 [Deltaproteobacteria bacterium]|nr:hypothetical protein [Deltaproteobacteria bacterium]
MAMLFAVAYPGGERTIATGYPGAIVVVREVPRGPEACLFDELEIAATDEPGELGPLFRVVRIAGGPRRPTLRVRLDAAADRDAWLDAREAEGWWTATAPGDPDDLWLVRPDAAAGVTIDDDRRTLAQLGARVVP